jgi:hypothetical protein
MRNYQLQLLSTCICFLLSGCYFGENGAGYEGGNPFDEAEQERTPAPAEGENRPADEVKDPSAGGIYDNHPLPDNLYKIGSYAVVNAGPEWQSLSINLQSLGSYYCLIGDDLYGPARQFYVIPRYHKDQSGFEHVSLEVLGDTCDFMQNKETRMVTGTDIIGYDLSEKDHNGRQYIESFTFLLEGQQVTVTTSHAAKAAPLAVPNYSENP